MEANLGSLIGRNACSHLEVSPVTAIGQTTKRGNAEDFSGGYLQVEGEEEETRCVERVQSESALSETRSSELRPRVAPLPSPNLAVLQPFTLDYLCIVTTVW